MLASQQQDFMTIRHTPEFTAELEPEAVGLLAIQYPSCLVTMNIADFYAKIEESAF